MVIKIIIIIIVKWMWLIIIRRGFGVGLPIPETSFEKLGHMMALKKTSLDYIHTENYSAKTSAL